MDQVPGKILDEWFYLHGVSPDKSTWVNFDVEQTSEGRFRIWVESSPEHGPREYRISSYGSANEALNALQTIIQTHPSFRSFEFGLTELEPIRVVAESPAREKPQTTGEKQPAPQDNSQGPTQTDRARQDNSNNQRVEDILEPADVPGEPSNSDRSDATSANEFKTTGTRAADQWDSQVGEARSGIANLQQQLDDYVGEGGSVLVATAGATLLGAVDLAMGFTQGLADTARLGKGISQGTWSGVKEDLERLTNILPQGKIAKLINAGLSISSVGEAAMSGSSAGAGIEVASIVAAAVMKKLHAKNTKSVKMDAVFEGSKKVSVHVPKKEIKKLLKRANEFNKAIPELEREYLTLATHLVYNPKAQKSKQFYIGLAANKKRVPPKYRSLMKQDEAELIGAGNSKKGDNMFHAEPNGIEYTWGQGHGVVMIVTSNNPCTCNLSNCKPMLDEHGIAHLWPKEAKQFVENLFSK